MSASRHRQSRALAPTAQPLHCPNRHCTFYEPSRAWKWLYDGFFTRPSDHRRFQRFRCSHCGRRFSTRTFAADYWLRRRALFPQITRLASEGPGLRQSARLLSTSHACVARQLARAGRHCLLLHQELVRSRPIQEPLVLDGFETFEFSQFFPFHLNLAVGAESWFLHHFNDSPLRRKGAMTPEQRARRAELEATLGRPDPQAVEHAVAELIRVVSRRWRGPEGSGKAGTTSILRLRSGPGSAPGAARETAAANSCLILHSDDHPAYRRALRTIRQEQPEPRIRHLVTSSTERRTTSNPLFPVNLADLLLRHGQANHRRETIAFSKRRQRALERLAVFTVWRNLIKRRREKRPGETAAMVAGIVDRPLSWGEVLGRRRFPRRRTLPGMWWRYYWGKVKTLALGKRQREHELKYAF